MIVDTNLLVYAVNPHASQHKKAALWLGEQFAGTTRVGLPWHSLLGFVRLVSDPKIHKSAGSVEQAWGVVRSWLSIDSVWIPQPTGRHADVLNNLFALGSVRSRDVMDMHLAALAIEHDLTLWSADKGFARYPQVKWIDPLAA